MIPVQGSDAREDLFARRRRSRRNFRSRERRGKIRGGGGGEGGGGGGSERKRKRKMTKENVHSHFRALSAVRRYPPACVATTISHFRMDELAPMRVRNPGQPIAVG